MDRAFLAIGMDVGSTTVKATVVDPHTKQILWSDYQRHHTKQPEKVLELLEMILAAFPNKKPEDFRIFLTGSGSAPIWPEMSTPAQNVRSPATAMPTGVPFE